MIGQSGKLLLECLEQRLVDRVTKVAHCGGIRRIERRLELDQCSVVFRDRQNAPPSDVIGDRVLGHRSGAIVDVVREGVLVVVQREQRLVERIIQHAFCADLVALQIANDGRLSDDTRRSSQVVKVPNAPPDLVRRHVDDSRVAAFAHGSDSQTSADAISAPLSLRL